MILQEEFRKNGYKDILKGGTALEYGINLEDIYDVEQKPEELLNIFISDPGDELFFLLDGDQREMNSLCDLWDDRIRIFTIISGKSEMIHKLKYNIVQLIVYYSGIPDKSREGNLLISRKIILKGNMDDKTRIVIDDAEAIELPFHMIPSDTFVSDETQTNQLKQLLPEDEELLNLLKKEPHKVKGTGKDGITSKYFEVNEYEKIKEWLER